MGHKTHPLGFRLGIIKDWKTHWYANNGTQYRDGVQQDLGLRRAIHNEYAAFADAGIARIEIDRTAQETIINIHSARPGILIGRDGDRVKGLRSRLETMNSGQLRLNIVEIEQPELDPFLVGRNIADQLSRRVAYRRGHAAGCPAHHASRSRRESKSSPKAAFPEPKSPAPKS